MIENKGNHLPKPLRGKEPHPSCAVCLGLRFHCLVDAAWELPPPLLVCTYTALELAGYCP